MLGIYFQKVLGASAIFVDFLKPNGGASQCFFLFCFFFAETWHSAKIFYNTLFLADVNKDDDGPNLLCHFSLKPFKKK